MKRDASVFLIAIAVVLITVAIAAWQMAWRAAAPATPDTGSQTQPALPALNRMISDGTIAISFPGSDFGLATNQKQLLVHSYIPPCDQGFRYCLYYIGSAYNGTNFESAGLAIRKRADLPTKMKCLAAPPDGYINLTPKTVTSVDYSAGDFLGLGNAATGHMAADDVYRLFVKGSCYEFDTRVGESQFANYPSGTIREFTVSDAAAMRSELRQILGTLRLSTGEGVSFPT